MADEADQAYEPRATAFDRDPPETAFRANLKLQRPIRRENTSPVIPGAEPAMSVRDPVSITGVRG